MNRRRFVSSVFAAALISSTTLNRFYPRGWVVFATEKALLVD